ncbi:hypothetical protein [Neorhizobium sp. P12A]|uniref:hypothetical protein n=1 Tax=Neorhizobium sp. P12A TaxID=2268027 RepID=UPI00165EAAAF|nr:hypothetical protein [Neorhizobium sp. P12A]
MNEVSVFQDVQTRISLLCGQSEHWYAACPMFEEIAGFPKILQGWTSVAFT